MRVPIEWLHEYCAPEMTTAELAERLAMTGTEVERIEHHGVVYVSGQLPMTLDTREPFAGPIEEQTELALRNVEHVLKAAGSDLSRVLQMTIYISVR